MPSPDTYERFASLSITPAQERQSALRAGLLRAANLGLQREWRLRQMGKLIQTEAELDAALDRAQVPASHRAAIAKKIRGYSRIPTV